MPVTQTVSERILREIVDRLEGYSVSGKEFTVYRELTDPERMTPTNYQVVVKTLGNTRQPALDRIGNPPAIAYDLQVGLYGQVDISEDDTDPAEGHCTEIAGRIVSAIVNASDWYKFGGDAINATIGDVQTNTSGGYQTGQVILLVTYRVREGDPFTASA